MNVMLRITSHRGRTPRIKRRVEYSAADNPSSFGGNFQEIVREKEEKQKKREQDLENRFKERLRSTASGWTFRYELA